MSPLIDYVIGETPDNVELIRDQVGAILKVELEHQATLTGRPQPRVFVERSNPWGMFLEGGAIEPPIINVELDTVSFDGAASNIVERQRADAVYNVDCYGYGVSTANDNGHEPGDQRATLECQRTVRLVRNILMSAHYTYLGLRGVVWKRWPQTITMLQPQMDDRAIQNIAAARFALAVQFNEFSPQVTGETLESLSIEVFRAGTGELYLRADYPTED